MALAVAQLGERIRALRGAAGLTQEQCAARAMLDPKHWQEIEAGRTNPTLATLVGVARALDVDLATLFESNRLRRSASGERAL